MSNSKTVLKFVAKLQAAARNRGDSVFSTEELVTFVNAMSADLKVASPMELIEVSGMGARRRDGWRGNDRAVWTVVTAYASLSCPAYAACSVTELLPAPTHSDARSG
jgi:hypothetical protein